MEEKRISEKVKEVLETNLNNPSNKARKQLQMLKDLKEMGFKPNPKYKGPVPGQKLPITEIGSFKKNSKINS